VKTSTASTTENRSETSCSQARVAVRAMIGVPLDRQP
jgi:hypothetical protein